MMVLVDADVSITELDGRYGAELLRTNVNRDAATLEEWVRYPVTKRKGRPKSARGNFGYKENSWSVLEDTTIFGVAGNPSWQADRLPRGGSVRCLMDAQAAFVEP